MNLEALKAHRFDDIIQQYCARDSMLYALGLGYGENPTDPTHLQFVYEGGLKSVPSMVNILAHPGMWVKKPALGIDWTKLLHVGQSFEILHPAPPEGCLTGSYRITAVEDLGAARGARLYFRKDLCDGSGRVLAIVRSTYLLRGDGGAGGFGTPEPALAPIADRTADTLIELRTLPQQALIYRLSGDRNPLHVEPELARRAGFQQPILHGLCSMGLATRGIISAIAPQAPERLRSMSLRFSRPVIPGDRLQVQIHDMGQGQYQFRVIVPERQLIVIDRGHAAFV